MPREDLPPGTIVAGRYRVLSTAGSGGMGVVYVVEHVNTGGRGALKIMRGHATDRSVERFRREARASGMIHSDHVVKVTDADVAPELDDAPFLVMELLHGEDLSQRLSRTERLDRQPAIDILVQVARGLERAHAAGVVHRDLKPQNIFLHEREDGAMVVKLVDFGISRIQPKADGREITGLTRAEDVFGTPSWMSPEQAMSMHHAVGPATDIWAVGLLAFRMLHGDSYWGEREAPQILVALMQPEREVPSEIDPTLSPAFDRWFLKSCARDPERRFQDALEQIEALADALNVELPRVAAPPSPGTSSAGRGPQLIDPTPATGVNHQLMAVLKGGDEDESTAHGKKAGHGAGRALAKPPELVRAITPEPITPEPVTPVPTPRKLTRPGLVTKTAPLPGFHGEASLTPVGSILAPTDQGSLEPLLYAPAKPEWQEKLKPHLLWLVPTMIFGTVFVAGLIWIMRDDPPPMSRAPAAPQSAAVVESAAPPPEEPAAVAPAAPGPSAAPRPRPKRAPAPHRDAFDTQK